MRGSLTIRPTLWRWRDILGRVTVEGAACGVTAAFALWTLCANAAYALRLPLLAAAALWCFGAAGVVAFALWRGLSPAPLQEAGRGEGRSPRATSVGSTHDDAAATLTPALSRRERGPDWLARLPVLLAAVLTLVAWRATGQFLAVWAGTVVVALAGVWVNLLGRQEHPDAREGSGARHAWVVWGLAAVAALLALLVRSFSVDDAYYLNRAAQLAENVWAPMPRHYGLFGDGPVHGIGLMPFPYPTFPLTAYHDLLGLFSALTWLQPLQLSSIFAAPIAAALVPVAYATLLRRILPANLVPWALVVAMALLLVEATGERFVSQFGLPRIWQGKSILLHVGLPITLAWAIDLGRSGRVGDGVKLAAAAVALVGLNSMGIWIGPVVAGTGVFVGLLDRSPLPLREPPGARAERSRATDSDMDAQVGQPSPWPSHEARAGVKRAAVAVALLVVACAYPGLLAWWFAGGSSVAVGYRFTLPDLEQTLTAAFGSGRVMTVWLAAMLLGPVIAPTRTARLLAAVSLVVTFGVGLNPWLAPLVAKHVTSGVLYWRVLWVLPMVPLAASVACAGLPWRRYLTAGELLPGLPLRRAAAGFAVLAVIAIYASVVPQRWTVSRGNGVGLGWPGVKAPAGPWAVATKLRRELPGDAPVLAPTSVSWLLVTMVDGPSAIVPRPIAVEHAFDRQIGRREEAYRRLEVATYLGGQKDLDAVKVWDAVLHDRVAALVLRPSEAPDTSQDPSGSPEASIAGSDDSERLLPSDPRTDPLTPAGTATDGAGRARLRDRLTAQGFVRSDVAGFEVWLRQGPGADER